LQRIQKELDLPVITDVHSPSEATLVGSTLEAIQIPAFLSRQTDLLIAAAKTPALVSVKKGQFLSPWDMSHVVDKLRAFKEQDILLTDRGTTFGYNQLITDIRAIPIMQSFKVPVCFDASHSIQKPGGLGSKSGGDSEFIPILSRAAIAAGADALYIECHPKPQEAMSDGAS
jgi:2-dehydro-3-deoxyphosphooctonate aldolase (KDO 8-P synthase)